MTGSQRVGIFSMIVLSAKPASLRFGSIECVLTSKMSGGRGESAIAVRRRRSGMEIQSIGPGRSTVQRTYFFTSSNIQSRRGAEALRGSTRKKTVSMKMPAKLMPSAIKTPS